MTTVEISRKPLYKASEASSLTFRHATGGVPPCFRALHLTFDDSSRLVKGTECYRNEK